MIKKSLCVALVLSAFLPWKAAAASSKPPEVGFRVEVHPVIKPVEMKLEPLGSLELIRTPMPNPCLHGCGYEWGNCTFGVAQWREAFGAPVGNNWGNAKEWLGNASAAGFQVGPVPYVGSVGVSTGGYFGHVVFVEAVNGTQVLIKEMNSLGLGVTDEQWVPIGRFTYIGI